MVAMLGIGDRAYEKYDLPFLKSPDGTIAELPAIPNLRAAWTELHERINTALAAYTPQQWLERHSAVSPEDFVSQPQRNKLALVMSRTAHLAYHLGQLAMLKA